MEHPLHVGVRLLPVLPAELLALEAAEDAARRVVHHGAALFADHPGNGGGEEGLAQARAAGEQQVAADPRREIHGIGPAGVVHPLHILPGRDAHPGIPGLGVPVQGEGLKALGAQVQHPGELLLLLPGVVFLQAPAHAAIAVPRVPAEGADGRLLQGVLRIAHLRKQPALFCLEAQVLVPQHLHRRQGIRPPAHGGGNDAAGGAGELRLNLPQPGLAAEDGLPPGLKLLLPGTAVLLELLHRPAQDPSVVGHVVTPPCLAAG